MSVYCAEKHQGLRFLHSYDLEWLKESSTIFLGPVNSDWIMSVKLQIFHYFPDKFVLVCVRDTVGLEDCCDKKIPYAVTAVKSSDNIAV